MKTLYIECNMGAAGDMLMAALLELIDDKEAFLRTMNGLGLEGVKVSAEPSVKSGITGTRISVAIGRKEESSIDEDMTGQVEEHDRHHDYADDHYHEHEGNDHTYEDAHGHAHSHDYGHPHDGQGHHHADLNWVRSTISALPVLESVKKNAMAVYDLIAEAESYVHGRPIDEVHFHEVGSLDAIADIAGVCLLMERLAVDKVVVSPVHVGSGFVRCAHGVLPVPAPATARILRDVPTYGGRIKGELCTPTGAALLKHFANEFGPMPEIRVQKIGYGMGKKDFEAANCVRAFLGETADQVGGPNGNVAELRCNVDDMTGEALGYAFQMLMQAGARDVFTTAVQMKKDRPGTMLTVICDMAKADEFAALLLKHTTTFGVRKNIYQRYMLKREVSTLDTPYGPVRVKSGIGYGTKKTKLEYEDVVGLANRNDMSIDQMERKIWTYLKGQE